MSSRQALPTLLLFSTPASATDTAMPVMAWTHEATGYAALAIFALAYLLVVMEERTRLRKSKPVVLAAALIWGLIALKASTTRGLDPSLAQDAFRSIFVEFAGLFFFLVVAMSYVAAIAERNVFEAMRAELVSRGFSFKQLFWLTGLIGFFLSPILDNLTTALVMSSVILAVGAGNERFVKLSFISLVVAVNAGGAWSAFGDITTLMVWQGQKAEFFEFFRLLPPSLVNWLVPAAIMHFWVPAGRPAPSPDDAEIKRGGWAICLLFGVTIAITIGAKQFLHMPPVFGMMAGLALLNIVAYWIANSELRDDTATGGGRRPYSIFRIMANAEWDTLLFFYGVLLSVGGLAAIGYLAVGSELIYSGWGHTWANIVMGALSAVVDNIPIMYAVLQMNPPMDSGQWLLITLTCGVGGSILSVGSAAGVALMGQSRGLYTFSTHLKWIWAIVLGYVLSVLTHLWWSADRFTNGFGA